MSLLKLENISVGYPPAAPLLSGLDLSLEKGQVACIAGRNGSGKSTLMRTLAGVQKPLAGTVRLDDKILQELSPNDLARTLAIVTTEHVPVGHLRVEEMVSLGRYPYTGPFGKLNREDRRAVGEAMEMTGCHSLAGQFTYTLSDGQWQRVMIARALAQEPVILLLDEPTGFLDWPGKAGTFKMLRQLASAGGPAIVFASHDLEMALPVSDVAWVLDEQKILSGTPEDTLSNGTLEKAFGLEPGTILHNHYAAARVSDKLTVTGPAHLQRLVSQALARENSRKPITLRGVILADDSEGRMSLQYQQEGTGRLAFSSVQELLQYVRKEN
ncbi:MAG: ABC transporter ATP-binding protein [Cyclobacteriaceae bacterium]